LGPALRVAQTGVGAGYPVADFYDNDVSTTVPALRIADGGNVGIGTEAPLEKLHVQGSVLASTQFLGQAADSVNAPSYSWTGDTNVGIYRPATDTLGVVTSGAERMRVDASGNVGIGTTNPQVKLDVRGSLLLDVFAIGGEEGIFFRNGFTTTGNKYNSSILNYDHNSTGGSPDGISINGFDGVSICTGLSTRNERMRVDGSGNVGIGTTNPQARLQVVRNGNDATYGILSIENSQIFGFNTGAGVTSGLSFRSQWSGDALYPNTTMGQINCVKENSANYGDSYLSFHTRYTADRSAGGEGILSERVRINSTGNVGIGTVNPLSILHVNNTGSLCQARITGATQNPNNSGGDLASSEILLGTSSFHATIQTVVPSGAYIDQQDIRICTTPTNNNNTQIPRMTIKSFTGNVGIGTTNPQERLHVIDGNIKCSGNILTGTGVGALNIMYNGSDYYGSIIGKGVTYSAPNYTIYSDGGNKGLSAVELAWRSISFYTGYLGNGSTNTVTSTLEPYKRMTIDMFGNVGIGTTDPQAKLHVEGTIKALTGPGAMHIGDAYDPTGYGILQIARPQTHDNKGYISMVRAGSTVWTLGIVSGTNTFAIRNGNLGGDGVYIDPGQSSWSSGSDRRLKTNISLIPDALDKVLGINGVYYNYNTDASQNVTQRRVGVIAQDVLTVLPEAVSEDLSTKMYGVRYTELIPLLINSVKELSAKVDILQAEIQSLKLN
jgi:hypothetical protein